MQVFEDRQDAGKRLATALASHSAVAQGPERVVLGVPRGGLPVGAEVALALNAPLDVVVVRKLRCPHNPELGFGAVGPNGHVELNHDLIAQLRLSNEQVDAEVADRRAAVEQRLEMYRDAATAPTLAGVVAIVVDDGVATGGTARLACSYARHAGASDVVFATPVAPKQTAEQLHEVADHVVVLSSPAEFLSVGQVYRDFTQLSDQEVVAALERVGPG